MIFTNESGEKFEECLVDSRPEHIVIRPVKQELKWEVTPPGLYQGWWKIGVSFEGGGIDQAQLIKEAISQTMRRIAELNPTLLENDFDFLDSLDKARQSMKENQ